MVTCSLEYSGKNVYQFKNVGMGITHTHVTLCVIALGVLNRLDKLTPLKPYFNYERVDNVFPDHVNSLCKVGLAPLIPQQWENYVMVNMKN